MLTDGNWTKNRHVATAGAPNWTCGIVDGGQEAGLAAGHYRCLDAGM